MLTILHGDDTAASRKHFLDEKGKRPNALLLDGEKITITDLTQIFEGGGLFVSNQEVFVEQFVHKRKKSSDFKQIVEYMETNASDHTIFLWEAKEIDRFTLMAFKKALARPFKLPQTLFIIMDSIKPGNGENLVKLYRKALETTEAEMIFYMLIRQFRLLLALCDTQTDNEIDELKKLSWGRAKLEKQASLFTKEQLKDIYSKLFILEKGQKTGGLAIPLPMAIDFLLVEI